MIDMDLRVFERKDFARLIGWVKSPEFLLQWAGPVFTYPLTETQLEHYIRGSEGDHAVRRIFKAIDLRDDAVVGHIELDNLDFRNKSATVCRVLVGEPSFRGRGVGSQMLRKLLEIGFDQLGLHRIDLVVFDFNTPAIKCYEKVGFLKEGCLREARRIGNDFWTLHQMSLLDHEWKALKQKH